MYVYIAYVTMIQTGLLLGVNMCTLKAFSSQNFLYCSFSKNILRHHKIKLPTNVTTDAKNWKDNITTAFSMQIY